MYEDEVGAEPVEEDVTLDKLELNEEEIDQESDE